VSNQTRINLLTMILDPNNNIAPGYDGYFVETADGRTFTGILGAESSSGITMRTPEGEEEIISRDRIVSFRPISTSLMPEGLEAGLTNQDMADLIEYLKNGIR
jgi:putative heme-binding domain-containing protein